MFNNLNSFHKESKAIIGDIFNKYPSLITAVRADSWVMSESGLRTTTINDIEFTMGVDRLVLIPKHHKYVIKIPFNIQDFDACKFEIEVYEHAKGLKIDGCFAEIVQSGKFNIDIIPVDIIDYRFLNSVFSHDGDEFVGRLDNFNDLFLKLKELYIDCVVNIDLPYYLAEYAGEEVPDDNLSCGDCDGCNNDEFESCTIMTARLDTTINYSYTGLHDLDPHIYNMFIEQYGMDDFLLLRELLKEYDLTDFHNGNVGCLKNGNIVILDYAA
jgi:hypothetical protein